MNKANNSPSMGSGGTFNAGKNGFDYGGDPKKYLDMSDCAGQDTQAASKDMVDAMLTQGGLLKKAADSVACKMKY